MDKSVPNTNHRTKLAPIPVVLMLLAAGLLISPAAGSADANVGYDLDAVCDDQLMDSMSASQISIGFSRLIETGLDGFCGGSLSQVNSVLSNIRQLALIGQECDLSQLEAISAIDFKLESPAVAKLEQACNIDFEDVRELLPDTKCKDDECDSTDPCELIDIAIPGVCGNPLNLPDCLGIDISADSDCGDFLCDSVENLIVASASTFGNACRGDVPPACQFIEFRANGLCNAEPISAPCEDLLLDYAMENENLYCDGSMGDLLAPLSGQYWAVYDATVNETLENQQVKKFMDEVNARDFSINGLTSGLPWDLARHDDTAASQGEWTVALKNEAYGVLNQTSPQIADHLGQSIPLHRFADGGVISQSVNEGTKTAMNGDGNEGNPTWAKVAGWGLCGLAIGLLIAAFFFPPTSGMAVAWAGVWFLNAGGMAATCIQAGQLAADNGDYWCSDDWENWWGINDNSFAGGWEHGIYGDEIDVTVLEVTSSVSHNGTFSREYEYDHDDDESYKAGKSTCEGLFETQRDASAVEAAGYMPTANLNDAEASLEFTIPLLESVYDLTKGQLITTFETEVAGFSTSLIIAGNSPVLVTNCSNDCPLLTVSIDDCGAGEIGVTGKSGENVEYIFAGKGTCFSVNIYVEGQFVAGAGVPGMHLDGHFVGAVKDNKVH